MSRPVRRAEGKILERWQRIIALSYPLQGRTSPKDLFTFYQLILYQMCDHEWRPYFEEGNQKGNTEFPERFFIETYNNIPFI